MEVERDEEEDGESDVLGWAVSCLTSQLRVRTCRRIGGTNMLLEMQHYRSY